MATLKELMNSTRQFKPALFDNAKTVTVTKINVSRFKAPSQSVLFSAETKDRKPDGSGESRVAKIRFAVPADRDPTDFVPSMSKDACSVRSNSPFFKFAFGYSNKDAKAHYGPVSTFQVKGTGKPLNPRNMIGLDKHLIALANYLKQKGYIRG